MATTIWRGDAPAVAQVNTITPSNVNIGNTFTLTINGKSITFTATAATVPNVTAGLVALVKASTIAEFRELTAADNTTTLTLTAAKAGKPFTQTSSAAGGTAALNTSTSTTSSGPNDASVAANWDRGGSASLPQAADDVYVDGSSSLWWNLGTAINAVSLTSFTVRSSFTGQIGLPVISTDGGYYEYRAKYFLIRSTTTTIGDGPGPGSNLMRIDNQAVATTLIVRNTANNSAELNAQALRWLGSNASNIVEVLKGFVGIAMGQGETATVTTLHVGYTSNVGGDSVVRCGSGTTLTTINQAGGDLLINSGATTITQTAGVFTSTAGAITTLTVHGVANCNQVSVTITTVNVGGTGTFARQDMRALTITNANLYKGAKIAAPFGGITWSNPVSLVQCRGTEVSIDVGVNKTLALT